MGVGGDKYNFDSSEGCDWETSNHHSLKVNLFGVYCNSSTCANNRASETGLLDYQNDDLNIRIVMA